MKNENRRNKTTIVGNTIQNKQISKKGKSGTRIRRLLAKNWAYLEHGTNYIKAISIEVCNQETSKVENELFDGVFLKLNVRNRVKPYNVQMRILRKVIEKRQAKPIHRRIGRTKDLFANYLLCASISKNMNNITKKQCMA